MTLSAAASRMSSETCSSSTPPEWTVLYHGAGKTFKGRGEFLRIMLEDKGVPYQNSDANLYGPKGIMDAFRGSPQAILADAEVDGGKPIPFPVLYPPAVWHRPGNNEEDVIINQSGASMMYIGDMLGYAPSSPAERARANAILLNAMDYLAEGRSSFHPVKDHMSYKDQKEEGDRASKEFTTSRMLTYLYHFHKITPSPVAGGPTVTYADFALFQVLDATANQFNSEHYEQAWDKVAAELPALKAYYDWMRLRPNLQAYFASERCPPWAGDSMM